MTPITLAPPAWRRVLVICPHPDDETLGAGLFLQEAVARGAAIRIVYLSDGERTPLPQLCDEVRWPWCQPARTRWGARRRDESCAALQVLGVPLSAAEYWALGDTHLGKALQSEAALLRLTDLLTDFDPTVIVGPSAHDLHPDHRAANAFVRHGIVRAHPAAPPLHLTYRVHGRIATGDAIYAPPALPARQRRKALALESHRTQLVLSRRRMTAVAMRPEVFRIAEADALERHHPFRRARRLLWLLPWLNVPAGTAQPGEPLTGSAD